MLIYGEVDTFTRVTKSLNTLIIGTDRQNVGDKVHIREGKSPEYKLRT